MKQLMIIVLNKTEFLEKILSEFGKQGIKGATVLDSKGMAHSLSEYNELRFMASLRMVLDPEHEESKTIFTVITEDKIPVISKIVNDATGGLDKPDTGIMFTLPVNYTEGLGY